MDVSRNSKTLPGMVRERIVPGFTVMTDENGACKSFIERKYDHHHDTGENGPELFDQLFSSSGI